jgi:hypothetical protein
LASDHSAGPFDASSRHPARRPRKNFMNNKSPQPKANAPAEVTARGYVGKAHMKTRHILKLPTRTFVCEITEHRDRITINVPFDNVDLPDEFSQWMGSILLGLVNDYRGDPRPFQKISEPLSD